VQTVLYMDSRVLQVVIVYKCDYIEKEKQMGNNKPKSLEEVYEVMAKYSKSKGYNITDSDLKFMAENMFLTFEAKKWSACKYWPPLAMRWVLTNKPKYVRPVVTKPRQGKSVRDRILEQRGKDEF